MQVRALALSLLLVGAACSGGSASRAVATTTTRVNPFATAAPGATGLAPGASGAPGAPPGMLEVGQCFDTTTFVAGQSIDPADVTVVPCADPHQHEVYAVLAHPAGKGQPYPGETTLDQYADDRCVAAFEAYVGFPYDRSSLDFATVHPNAASWAKGDRQVACTLHDADLALLTGSVKGAQR